MKLYGDSLDFADTSLGGPQLCGDISLAEPWTYPLQRYYLWGVFSMCIHMHLHVEFATICTISLIRGQSTVGGVVLDLDVGCRNKVLVFRQIHTHTPHSHTHTHTHKLNTHTLAQKYTS